MLASYFECGSVAANDDGVYFDGDDDDGDGTFKVSATTQAPRSTIGPGGIFAASSHALFIATQPSSNGGSTEIVRIDTSGAVDATPVTVVANQPEITALAVDETNIFWATWDGTNGAIFMAPQ